MFSVASNKDHAQYLNRRFLHSEYLAKTHLCSPCTLMSCRFHNKSTTRIKFSWSGFRRKKAKIQEPRITGFCHSCLSKLTSISLLSTQQSYDFQMPIPSGMR